MYVAGSQLGFSLFTLLLRRLNLEPFLSDPTCRLLPPKSPERPADLTALIGALATRFNVTIGVVKRHLRTADIEEWGKVQRIDSDEGDVMRTAHLGSVRDDSRDATFVRVSASLLLTKVNAHPSVL